MDLLWTTRASPNGGCVCAMLDSLMNLPALPPLSFPCPRCRTQVDEAFYGPCGHCRGELRASLGGEARVVETEAFEPKMNVTPNNVAGV